MTNHPKNTRYSIKNNCFTKQDSIIYRISTDSELWLAFKANIAVQFQDSYHFYKKKHGKKVLNRQDIHTISNEAAENFLSLWTS